MDSIRGIDWSRKTEDSKYTRGVAAKVATMSDVLFILFRDFRRYVQYSSVRDFSVDHVIPGPVFPPNNEASP